jgi:hypothetical protein
MLHHLPVAVAAMAFQDLAPHRLHTVLQLTQSLSTAFISAEKVISIVLQTAEQQ